MSNVRSLVLVRKYYHLSVKKSLCLVTVTCLSHPFTWLQCLRTKAHKR